MSAKESLFASLLRLRPLLGPRDRLRFTALLLLQGVAAVTEIVGISLLFPFIAIATDATLMQRNAALSWIYAKLGFESAYAFLVFSGLAVVGGILAASLAGAGATWATQRFAHSFGNRISQRLLGSHLAGPYELILHRNPSALVVEVVDEAWRLVNYVVVPALQVAGRACVVILVAILMLAADPLLGVIVTALLGGAYVILYFVVHGHLSRLGEASASSLRERYRVVQEAIGGIREIKLFQGEAFFLSRFEAHSRVHADSQVSSALISALPRYAMEAVAFATVALGVLYLAARTDNVAHFVPILALYAVAGYRLIPSLQQIYAGLSQLRFGVANVGSLLGDTHRLAARRAHAGDEPEPAELAFASEIRVAEVSFAYQGRPRPALRNLSLTIPRGSLVGLVGRSGSGKTTTLEILLGLLQPSSGGVYIDGVRLDGRNMRAWQRRIGYVPQNPYLSDDSIARNIAFGLPDEKIDWSRVEQAGILANAHAFVSSMPEGYRTRAGDRGVGMSGGQRQRIAIARALYRDPSVVVFDEATNALDAASEQPILETQRSLAGQRTVIIVAHRAAVVQHCNPIFVLDEGRLADGGTYDELMARSEAFRALAQARDAELELAP
jgi:ABC-type multidrug transport system fused ATPase/permease subunit